MSDFRWVRGFEEAWRPPVGRRPRPEAVLGALAGPAARARLARIVRRAPEVMVKVTGRTRDPAHLEAHLDYVSRNGQLDLEGPDGWPVRGRAEVRDLAEAWSDLARADSRRRANSPVSVSVVLSMPAGTDPFALRDATRAFAAEIFGGRFDYVFALHTDEPHPHAHVTVLALGRSGQRLNPKKADLEAWRQAFAQALRDRGVEAEATPRRARGVTRKAERGVLRRIRERAAARAGPPARVEREAVRAAARAAFGGDGEPRPWEARLVARQRQVRALYLAQARLLQASPEPADQALGREVAAFVASMPEPDSRRLALARALRAANAEIGRDLSPAPGGRDDPDRQRGR